MYTSEKDTTMKTQLYLERQQIDLLIDAMRTHLYRHHQDMTFIYAGRLEDLLNRYSDVYNRHSFHYAFATTADESQLMLDALHSFLNEDITERNRELTLGTIQSIKVQK